MTPDLLPRVKGVARQTKQQLRVTTWPTSSCALFYVAERFRPYKRVKVAYYHLGQLNWPVSVASSSSKAVVQSDLLFTEKHHTFVHIIMRTV